MHLRHSTFPASALAAALLSLSAITPAQITSTPQIVAWSEASGPALYNGVQLQDMDRGCAPAKLLCRSLLSGPQWYAGGTAYDPRHGSVWVTNGTLLHEIELGTCTVRCQLTAQVMTTGAVVSGLAMRDGGRRLLQLETMPGYLGLRSYDATQCPPLPLRDGCTMQLGTGAVAGGLAYDPVHDVVFVAVSTPTAIDWSTDVLVAADAHRCSPVCKVTLPRCGPFYPRSGAVTGLGFDTCRQLLYATNGRHTQSLTVTDPLHCAGLAVQCCATASAWDWKGLDVVPGWQQQTLGKSCVPWQCQPCAMQASLLGGDAVLGNRELALQLSAAAGGGRAVLVLAPSACTAGQPVSFLCGSLLPALQPAPYVSAPIAVQGPNPCGGEARHSLPIPVDRSLCGAAFCAQWVVACPGAVGTLGTSTALQFTVGG